MYNISQKQNLNIWLIGLLVDFTLISLRHGSLVTSRFWGKACFHTWSWVLMFWLLFQDLHTESWFLFLSSSRWLAIRLDWLCALFVTAVSFFCVLAADCM